MKNKRGMATIDLIEFVVFAFILIVVIVFFAYVFNLITTNIGLDVMAGAVNLSGATADTLGQINNSILDKLNLIGIMILFGMVLAMLINAYFTRNDYPKVFITLDLMIMVIAFVVSIYISNAYETIITTEAFTSFFTTYAAKPSQFLLNLPIWTTIIGIIIIIISYSDIPRTFRDETFMAGEQ